jgi:NDP-sugar pyrophosphorylase family protein
MFRVDDYLDLRECPFPELFDGCDRVWDALAKLPDLLRARLRPEMLGRRIGESLIGPEVQIGPGTVIEPGAFIQGPARIGANCEVRAGAYIRENVLAGDGCVLGHASEFKNCVLFNGVQAMHFNYVGDSLLGHRAHLGAGVVLSNFKVGGTPIRVGEIETGLVKLGTVLGDGADIGSGCVLNPGSIIGRGSVLYPNTVWRGVCPPGVMVKLRSELEVVPLRPRA